MSRVIRDEAVDVPVNKQYKSRQAQTTRQQTLKNLLTVARSQADEVVKDRAIRELQGKYLKDPVVVAFFDDLARERFLAERAARNKARLEALKRGKFVKLIGS